MNSVFTERVQIEKNVGKHFPRLRYEYLMSESFETILMNHYTVSLKIKLWQTDIIVVQVRDSNISDPHRILF